MHTHSSEPDILSGFAKAINHYVLTQMNDIQTTGIYNEQRRSCYKVKICTKPVGLCPCITVLKKMQGQISKTKFGKTRNQLFLLYLFQQDYCAYYTK